MSGSREKNERSALHSGHRDRMRSRFLAAHELGVFTEVEVLEMLLYYCIPRVNTNELAHRLIDKFGSLDEVLKREAFELAASGLVSESTAFTLSFMGSLCAYARKGFGDPYINVLDIKTLKTHIIDIFKGFTNESVLLMPLDSEFRVIKKVLLENGGRGKYTVDKADILREIVPTGSKELVIAHNHPFGPCDPSGNDVIVTRELAGILRELGITLIDHIIVGSNGALSMRECGYFYDLEFRS